VGVNQVSRYGIARGLSRNDLRASGRTGATALA
jgi:hypothetical protein